MAVASFRRRHKISQIEMNSIIYVRYDGRQSLEHFGKVKDWLDNLALGRMPEGNG
jgi:hypothetical protein